MNYNESTRKEGDQFKLDLTDSETVALNVIDTSDDGVFKEKKDVVTFAIAFAIRLEKWEPLTGKKGVSQIREATVKYNAKYETVDPGGHLRKLIKSIRPDAYREEAVSKTFSRLAENGLEELRKRTHTHPLDFSEIQTELDGNSSDH